MNWMVIVNPLAGSGSAGKMWPDVKDALSGASIEFSYRFTSCPAETVSITAQAIADGFMGIAVYGGDGTLSDTASAIVSCPCDPILAAIPAGSGNDWCRSVGLPSSSAAAIQVIERPSLRRVDTGICNWKGGERFFVNSAGIGLDAHVLRRALDLRKRIPFPKASYMASLVLSLFRPPAWSGTFRADGGLFHAGPYLTLTIGIGRYSGGGMLLSPSAVPDDGLLDGLALKPLNPFRIALNARRIWNGTLGKMPGASAGRGRKIAIEAQNGSSMILEADGELVGLPGNTTEIVFSCCRGSLLAAVPAT